MMTRRAKLRRIFELAVEQGKTVSDLLLDIEDFTAQGNSGIENWVNTELAALETSTQPKVDTSLVTYHLNAALAELNK